MNAAARQIDSDFVAILEGDDYWNENFVDISLKVLESFDFSSSTQLEITQNGSVRRINDFPTPSGWMMSVDVFEKVGFFDEYYKWHLDNDWLGRLANAGFKMAHLVEATAPVDIHIATQVRPWLANCLRLGGSSIRLVRHNQLRPLVNRLVHVTSGMGQIAINPDARARSKSECQILIEKYGRIPW